MENTLLRCKDGRELEIWNEDVVYIGIEGRADIERKWDELSSEARAKLTEIHGKIEKLFQEAQECLFN